MKQTAVEWLISHLQKSKDWQRVLNEVSQMSTIQSDILNQAKAMEKEQIKVAWLNSLTKGDFNSAEEYYQSTYENQNS